MTATELSPPLSAGMRRALARAERGVSLDLGEATVLLSARGENLDRVLSIAGRLRDLGLEAIGRPGTITYSPKVFIPLTRLCRDRCGYCTFAAAPAQLPAPYLSPDEVLDIARAGAASGCKEALFTLGDRPEDRWRQAREWLDSAGYDTTLDYVRAMAILVLEETGLLPHVNAGVLSWQELQRLKPVAPSMGLMLETTSRRLYSEPGGPHYGSPDKDPAVRLRVLEDAGRCAIPFTTGLLIGIGETLAERVETLFAIRRVAAEFHGVQEVIVQNFCAKPRTAMAAMPDAELDDLAATVAVARILLGPRARIQAPPNLVGSEQALVLRAGIDDWGGVSPVTPDHVNPERPWPAVDALAASTSAAGFTLRQRLTVYPEYIRREGVWLDPRLRRHVSALADLSTGLADEAQSPVGLPWQQTPAADAWGSEGRVDLNVAVDTEGRRQAIRSDVGEVYGDWDEVRARLTGGQAAPARGDRDVAAALRAAADDPAGLTDAQALALLHARGGDLDALCELADDVRRDAVGHEVTYVVTRNINFTNVCYTGCRFCAFAQRKSDADAYTLSLSEVGDRVEEAWAAGATEVCMQGGIHPDMPGTAYFDLAAEVKRRCPDIHLHAFSPMEIVNGATRTGLSIREWLTGAREAGLDSIPGTAAEILDDEVRWVLTKGKLPTAAWVEVITTAHSLGIPTTSTIMYGHVDTPAHWVAHLRVIREIQELTGGFTEFVLLPFVHVGSPIYLAGLARPGPTVAETRALHAVSRLLLHGRIANIQCSWVKLGTEGCVDVLRGGVNDLGGTLMEETISRMAGSAHGSSRTVGELESIARAAGRPVRQRNTIYGSVPAERRAQAAYTGGVLGRRLLPIAPVGATQARRKAVPGGATPTATCHDEGWL